MSAHELLISDYLLLGGKNIYKFDCLIPNIKNPYENERKPQIFDKEKVSTKYKIMEHDKPIYIINDKSIINLKDRPRPKFLLPVIDDVKFEDLFLFEVVNNYNVTFCGDLKTVLLYHHNDCGELTTTNIVIFSNEVSLFKKNNLNINLFIDNPTVLNNLRIKSLSFENYCLNSIFFRFDLDDANIINNINAYESCVDLRVKYIVLMGISSLMNLKLMCYLDMLKKYFKYSIFYVILEYTLPTNLTFFYNLNWSIIPSIHGTLNNFLNHVNNKHVLENATFFRDVDVNNATLYQLKFTEAQISIKQAPFFLITKHDLKILKFSKSKYFTYTGDVTNQLLEMRNEYNIRILLREDFYLNWPSSKNISCMSIYFMPHDVNFFTKIEVYINLTILDIYIHDSIHVYTILNNLKNINELFIRNLTGVDEIIFDERDLVDIEINNSLKKFSLYGINLSNIGNIYFKHPINVITIEKCLLGQNTIFNLNGTPENIIEVFIISSLRLREMEIIISIGYPNIHFEVNPHVYFYYINNTRFTIHSLISHTNSKSI